MIRRWFCPAALFSILLLAAFTPACSAELTPEQKQTLAALQDDLGRIRGDVEQAEREDETYAGGLIKVLIGIRLEVLKTNAALVEQRIHVLEGGARTNVVVDATEPDPERADELLKEIQAQSKKVAEAGAEADRYSGGLVQALAETSVVTARNTLAMLEQQYFISKYGLAVPTLPVSDAATVEATVEDVVKTSTPTPAIPEDSAKPADCLEIATFDSSVLSSNEVFTELAWKVDVSNSCAEPFGVRVTFTIYDKDEFELDSDHEDVYVPAQGTGKARGKMLVSPPEKARRMTRQGASLALR